VSIPFLKNCGTTVSESASRRGRRTGTGRPRAAARHSVRPASSLVLLLVQTPVQSRVRASSWGVEPA
jgi:hypothetical protein